MSKKYLFFSIILIMFLICIFLFFGDRKPELSLDGEYHINPYRTIMTNTNFDKKLIINQPKRVKIENGLCYWGNDEKLDFLGHLERTNVFDYKIQNGPDLIKVSGRKTRIFLTHKKIKIFYENKPTEEQQEYKKYLELK